MSAVWQTPNHDDHDVKWQVGVSDPSLADEDSKPCIACLAEMLEDPSGLNVKKKLILAEMLRILGYHGNAVQVALSSDLRVTVHLALLLLEITHASEKTLASMAVEGVVQLVCLVKAEDLVTCILDALTQQSLKLCNYKSSLGAFTLVGQLLHAIPPLSAQLLAAYGPFVDFLVSGMSYPDDDVQSALCYVLVHLYGADSRALVPRQVSSQVTQAVLTILARTPPPQLQLNALGVLRTMLADADLSDMYMSCSEGPGVVSALKQCLLATGDLVPVAAVQNVTVLLTQPRGRHYAEVMLQQDMAEFLFEALTTSNELLISSLFSCLGLFAGVDDFYTKCHAMYGIESILRGVDQGLSLKNAQLFSQGLGLVAKMLSRHCGSVRLFSSAGHIEHCLSLVDQGLAHTNNNVFTQAAKVLVHLLNRNHLLSPIPWNRIRKSLTVLTAKMAEHPKMHCAPADTSRTATRGPTESAAVRALITQQRLCLSTEALMQAARLASSCTDDPLTDAATFTAQPSEGGGDVTLQNFFQGLLEDCDEVYLPALMSNWRYLSDVSAYQHVLSTMGLLGQLCSDAMARLAQKMAAAGFVTVILDIRPRLQSDALVDVDNFLVFIWSTTVPESMCAAREQMREALITSLRSLKCSSSDLVAVLRQNSATPLDPDLQAMQLAATAMLYVMLMYAESPLSKDVLQDSVQVYLQLHQDTIEAWLPFHLRHVTFLLACSSSSEQAFVCEGETKLVSILQTLDPLDVWCSIHPALLTWTFTKRQAACALAEKMISRWLICEDELQEISRLPSMSPFHQLVECSIRNERCLQTILLLVSESDSELVLRCVNLLEAVVHGHVSDIDEDQINQRRSLIASAVPQALHQTLLKEDKDIEGLSALLRLMCTLKRKQLTEPLQEVDFKLAFHLAKLFGEKPECQSMQLAVLNCLTCLLLQSLNQEQESRIAQVLLSCQEFLRVLHSTVLHSAVGIASPLLSLLVRMQALNDAESAAFHMDFDAEALLSALRCQSVCSTLCGLQLWASWLLRAGKPCCLRIKAHGHNDPQFPLPMDIMRELFIRIQQCLLQENPLVQLEAADCLDSYLQFVISSKLFLNHTISQPWNELILQTALEKDPTEIIPPGLLHLFLLLLENGTPYICHGLMQAVVRRLMDHRGVDSPYWMQILKEAHSNSIFPLNSSDHEKLQSMVSTISEQNVDTASSKGIMSTIFVDGILFPLYGNRSAKLVLAAREC